MVPLPPPRSGSLASVDEGTEDADLILQERLELFFRSMFMVSFGFAVLALTTAVSTGIATFGAYLTHRNNMLHQLTNLFLLGATLLFRFRGSAGPRSNGWSRFCACIVTSLFGTLFSLSESRRPPRARRESDDAHRLHLARGADPERDVAHAGGDRHRGGALSRRGVGRSSRHDRRHGGGLSPDAPQRHAQYRHLVARAGRGGHAHHARHLRSAPARSPGAPARAIHARKEARRRRRWASSIARATRSCAGPPR